VDNNSFGKLLHCPLSSEADESTSRVQHHVQVSNYSGYWGAESFGAVFCAALTNQTTGEILSFDATYWNYKPTRVIGVKNVESIVEEIRRGFAIGKKSYYFSFSVHVRQRILEQIPI